MGCSGTSLRKPSLSRRSNAFLPPLPYRRSLVEEGQRRLSWAAAFLQAEAAQQRAFDSESAVAEAAVAGVYAWRTAADYDSLGAVLDAAAGAMQVGPPLSMVQGFRV